MKFERLLILVTIAQIAATIALSQHLPKPKLRFVDVTDHVNNGVAVKGYEIEVVNREEFDDGLFQPSPGLPPCGSNTNAARTWLNIYDERGTRLYGWCAITSNSELASLRFLIPASKPQPKKLTLEFVDRFDRQITRSKPLNVN